VRCARIGRSTTALFVAALAIGCAPQRTALAYNGGPVSVEVLGWQESNGRIYCHQIGHDESGGEKDRIYYFDLHSGSAAIPHVLAWSKGQPSPISIEDSLRTVAIMGPQWRPSVEESLFKTRLANLRRSLRPVPTVDTRPTQLPSRNIAERDTTVGLGYQVRKQVREVELTCGPNHPPSKLQISTYGHDEVRCDRRFTPPGVDGQLVVLTYHGDPWPMLEEVQRAVWIPCGHASEIQVLDEPWGVR